MNKRQARRLAMLTIANDLRGSLDVSDEWERHPETDTLFTRADYDKVREEAARFLTSLEARIARMSG